MAARSVAPGPSRPVTRCGASPARRRRAAVRRRGRAEEVLVDLDVDVEVPVRAARRSVRRPRPAAATRARGSPARRRRRDAGLDDARRPGRHGARSGSRGSGSTWYGKKNVASMSSMNTGRLPSIIRTFVHSSPASLGGRQRRTGPPAAAARCEAWMTTFRITGRSRARRRRRHRPDGHPPDGPPGERRGPRSGVVEVDDQADPAAGDPDADAAPVVVGVHEVPVVAAVVRLLALEVQVRAEDRVERVARPAAEVLGPAVAV